MPATPAAASPLAHVKRAFGWNLATVVPSKVESDALAAAGVTDPVAQKYAAWRRSLLLVSLVPTAAAFVLAVVDTVQSGLGEYTTFGKALELTWLLMAAVVPVACVLGIRAWKKPGKTAFLLTAAWAVTFLLPFVYALLPVSFVYHVHPIDVAPKAAEVKAAAAKVQPKPKPMDDDDDEEEEAKPAIPLDPEKLEKAQAMQELAVEFVLSGGSYLLLLPAVLALIPGAMNGCLRVKSLIPAAQLPGWLLVCAAPAFLLFWLVILVMVNHAARSPLLVFGILLWSGAPLWYAIRGRVFVQSQIGDAAAAKIGGVKKLVGLTTFAGLGLMLAFLLTTKVLGLKIVGFERDKAVATKIDDLSDDDEVSLEDVQEALATSKSFVYALDLSSWRFVVDFLAKLFVVTAVFADLVLRATLFAWRNDRELRGDRRASDYDTSAAAAGAML